MSDQNSIKETLNTIRKALEDESEELHLNYEDTLLLDHLVQEDGTIKVLNDKTEEDNNTKEMINKKISEAFDEHLSNWLENNLPDYLDKYFNKNKPNEN
tara:strand:- start:161 stop:457 length:297 start_codon:yes stop_codon:yes gene_type:complete